MYWISVRFYEMGVSRIKETDSDQNKEDWHQNFKKKLTHISIISN